MFYEGVRDEFFYPACCRLGLDLRYQEHDTLCQNKQDTLLQYLQICNTNLITLVSNITGALPANFQFRSVACVVAQYFVAHRSWVETLCGVETVKRWMY